MDKQECLDDQTFFSAIGFTNVDSCDASEYEKPTYVFDLNNDTPHELLSKYDVIIDGGIKWTHESRQKCP